MGDCQESVSRDRQERVKLAADSFGSTDHSFYQEWIPSTQISHRISIELPLIKCNPRLIFTNLSSRQKLLFGSRDYSSLRAGLTQKTCEKSIPNIQIYCIHRYKLFGTSLNLLFQKLEIESMSFAWIFRYIA